VPGRSDEPPVLTSERGGDVNDTAEVPPGACGRRVEGPPSRVDGDTSRVADVNAAGGAGGTGGAGNPAVIEVETELKAPLRAHASDEAVASEVVVGTAVLVVGTVPGRAVCACDERGAAAHLSLACTPSAVRSQDSAGSWTGRCARARSGSCARGGPSWACAPLPPELGTV